MNSYFLKYLTEAVGMGLLVIIVNLVAATVKSKDSKMGKLRVAAAYGAATTIATFAFTSITGSIFNPALTVGLSVSGLFKWDQAWEYLLAQLIGAIIGQIIVVVMQYRHYQEMDDATVVLESFALVNPLDDRTYANRSNAMIQGAVSEFIASFIFFFATMGMLYYGILSIVSNSQSQASQGGTLASPTDPSTISQAFSGLFTGAYNSSIILGLLTFVLIATTGAALNPFRDFGPRLVHAFLPNTILGDAKDDSRWWYAWVPLIMPILAAIAAVALFKILYLKVN